MTKYLYDKAFLQYTGQSSAYSADVLTSLLSDRLCIRSVLDVGCAIGTWLHAWQNHGVSEFHGVDGDYVDTRMLRIPSTSFTAVNLNSKFDLGRKFDLVQSLEVGEHIDTNAAETYADCLVKHATRYILFSAAPPGQGGEFHVNEQPYDFWKEKLERRGFIAVDAIRPMIANDTQISYWYRYNIFLFVRHEMLLDLPPEFRTKVVMQNELLTDVSPILFRIRKALIRSIPYKMQVQIARFKARILPTGRI